MCESCCCCGVVVTGAGRSCRLHGRVWSLSGNRPNSNSFKEVCKTLNELWFNKPLQAADGYCEEDEEEEEEEEEEAVVFNLPELSHPFNT